MIQKTLSKYEFNIEANIEHGDYRMVDRFDKKCPYFNDKMDLSGDVCIDIGGHIGLFSLIASKLFKRVYSFEPVIENIFLFNQNIVLNSIMNIEVTNQAVDSCYGTKIIRIYLENYPGAGFYKGKKYQDKFNSGLLLERMIYITNLQAIKKQLKIGKIDFLKVSTNHNEYCIFQSLNANDLKNIKNIGVEYSLESPSSFKKITNILDKHNFNIKIIKHGYTGFIQAWQ